LQSHIINLCKKDYNFTTHTGQQITDRSRKQLRPILQDQDCKIPVSRSRPQSQGLLLWLLLSCAFTSHMSSTIYWTATSSTKWSCGRPPSSLVCGQLLTMWNIVWHLPHWHL